MIAILVGLVLVTGSGGRAAVAAAVPAAQTTEGEARCLSAQSLDDLFVVPPGFWENVGERDTLANYERRVFHHDDGRQVIEDVHQHSSPSDAIRTAARSQAGLSSNPISYVAVTIPCGTRTLLVVASGATYFSDEQMGPHPNAMLALETITNMIG
jgi:hypothetical protein